MIEKPTVLISVNAQLIGFFSSLAQKFMDEGHKVIFLSLKKGLAKYIRKNYEWNETVNVIDIEDISVLEISTECVLKKSLELEKKYDLKMSFLIAQDRGLGRGYLYNVDRYPKRYDAEISNEEKLRIICEKILIYEKIIEDYSLNLAIQLFTGEIEDKVFNFNNVKTITIGFARCSSDNMLFHNAFLENKKLSKTIDVYLRDNTLVENYEVNDLVQHSGSTKTHSRGGWNNLAAFKKAFLMFKKECIGMVKKRFKFDKKNGYYPFAWIPSKFREVSNYKFVSRLGKFPKDLSDYKIVYFPMHLEPEVALMTISPEFSNSLEALTWLSKSLPADYKIVIREHTLSFGVRSRWYYETLSQIGNIEFAHPSVHAWDWIKSSSFVSTITGSAGFEGVYLRKPILSYGKHQVINKLKTVEYASDYETTKGAVNKLINIPEDSPDFELMHKILEKSIKDASFTMEGFIDAYKDRKPKPEFANICYNEIIDYLEID